MNDSRDPVPAIKDPFLAALFVAIIFGLTLALISKWDEGKAAHPAPPCVCSCLPSVVNVYESPREKHDEP